mmetsp:Transcript_2563/g.8222  ORF Transcript_2563/g.8222 Transcript_2563/m.8222 type:complete len:201 (-) Transcript_2563:2025-2627(-)
MREGFQLFKVAAAAHAGVRVRRPRERGSHVLRERRQGRRGGRVHRPNRDLRVVVRRHASFQRQRRLHRVSARQARDRDVDETERLVVLRAVEDADPRDRAGVVDRGDDLSSPRRRRDALPRGEVDPHAVDFQHRGGFHVALAPGRGEPPRANDLERQRTEGFIAPDRRRRAARFVHERLEENLPEFSLARVLARLLAASE